MYPFVSPYLLCIILVLYYLLCISLSSYLIILSYPIPSYPIIISSYPILSYHHQDRSLRVWARGEDLVFVEEEKERALDFQGDQHNDKTTITRH